MTTRDRNFLAAEVMTEVLESQALDGPVLIMGEPTGMVAQYLGGRSENQICESWARRAGSNIPPTPLPPEGPFAAVLVRMTKSAEELRFAMALAAERLAPEAPVFLFGANDEGIRSATKAFQPRFEKPETLITKRHCRVFRGCLISAPTASDLEGFAQTVREESKDRTLVWTSWPGMFAHGRLDAGSGFLLDHLPELEPGARVLDYGCGAGVLSLGLRHQTPDLDITLFDNDALALQAAERTVEGAEVCCGTSLADVGEERFDLILSNPPVHDGKAQSYTVLERLIESAPDHLNPGGRLRLVVQGTTPVKRMLEASFKSAVPVAENRSFVIWDGLV